MTKAFTLNGAWAGQTIAVLGNSASLPDHLKLLPAGCKVIAASRAIEAYPQADVMVAIDGNTGPDEFEGLYVVGTPGDGPGQYVGMWYERVELARGHVIELRNTGVLAIRVAAMVGAARIVLAGFDTDAYEARYDGAYPGITKAFEALVADLRARGIEIVDLAVGAQDEHLEHQLP
jgi:hypothetical protein